MLARAFGAAGQLDACRKEITRVVEIAKNHPAVLIEAGQVLAKVGAFESSLRIFERVACSGDTTGAACTRVADAAERLSRLDIAIEFARKAITQSSASHEARLILARALRRQGAMEDAITTLHDAIAHEGAPASIRAKHYYELANVLDKTSQYRDAASALTKAKEQLAGDARMMRAHADEAAYTLRRIVQDLSPERVAQWMAASADVPPARVASIVGFPRSGTTLLEQILDAHPQIVSVEETTHLSSQLVTGMTRAVANTDSFAQTLDRVDLDSVNACRERYLKAMEGHIEGGLGDRHLIDKNPIRTLVMPFLRRAIPNATIIAAIRDPRDVVLSNLMQAFEPSAMNLAFLDVQEAGDFYALNMEGWIKYRALIRGWVEVRYEQVVVDPSREAARVLDELGLDWSDEVLRFHDHMPDRAVRSPTYAAVQEPVHSRAVRRWEHYAEYLAPAMPVLDRVAKALGYDPSC
jgi:tetratricopeptide (TPR) repeat protein